MDALKAEPRLNPAIAIELTDRERDAWMTREDWEWMLDKYFEDWYPVEVGEDT